MTYIWIFRSRTAFRLSSHRLMLLLVIPATILPRVRFVFSLAVILASSFAFTQRRVRTFDVCFAWFALHWLFHVLIRRTFGARFALRPSNSFFAFKISDVGVSCEAPHLRSIL